MSPSQFRETCAAAYAAQNARLTDMIDRARERMLGDERAPSVRQARPAASRHD